MTDSIDEEFIKDEASLDASQPAPEGCTWTAITVSAYAKSKLVDLDKLLGPCDYSAAYALAFVESPEEIKDVSILTGSDDYIEVWLNGVQALKYNQKCRNPWPDQDRAKGLTLKKGLNRILVKCVDINGGWGFMLRLQGKNGPMLYEDDK